MLLLNRQHMTYNLFYHPFPYNMKGQFFEGNEHEKTRFIEIYSLPYNENKIEEDKKRGIWEDSIVARYLEQLIRPITSDDEVYFLYQFRTYYADPTQIERWEFNESATSFEQYVFVSIDELLEYTNKRWGITIDDFVPIYETNIPH
ncbi:hypothetical protein ACK1QP_003967 [Salmonella enterica]